RTACSLPALGFETHLISFGSWILIAFRSKSAALTEATVKNSVRNAPNRNIFPPQWINRGSRLQYFLPTEAQADFADKPTHPSVPDRSSPLYCMQASFEASGHTRSGPQP